MGRSGRLSKLSLALFLPILGAGILWITPARQLLFPASQEKTDLLVFKQGQTLEAKITGEDRERYYVHLKGGTTSFHKNEVQAVKRNIPSRSIETKGNVFSWRLGAAREPAPRLKTKKEKRASQLALERRIAWEKQQAQTSREENTQAKQQTGNAPSAGESQESFYSTFRTKPCPYSSEG